MISTAVNAIQKAIKRTAIVGDGSIDLVASAILLVRNAYYKKLQLKRHFNCLKGNTPLMVAFYGSF